MCAAIRARALLRSRRPGVCLGYLATPRNEFGRAIVTIDDAFDQRRPVTVRESHFDGFVQFPTIGRTQAAAMTVLGIERLNQPGIVPVLDIVVGAVMNFNFDRVAVIVDKEDDNRQLPPNHLRNFLRGQLK